MEYEINFFRKDEAWYEETLKKIRISLPIIN